ncbi:uncharacterized protein [Ptychodera flava]|uniref:uncharacterized protein isoform X1 n=2 Tax=Ptychodera flava TaxID=63121 RepID=UPI00396A759A
MAASDSGTVKRRRIDSAEFNDFLCELSDYVKEDDFKRMKGLCRSYIPDGKLEKLSEPYDLFKTLIEYGLISEDDTEQLQCLLRKAGRTDLEEKVVMFMQSKTVKQQDTPRAVEWLIKYLKNSYRTHFNKFQPLPWNDDFSLYMSEVYTRLQMVEVDERGKIKTEKGNRNDDFLLTLSEVRSYLQMVEDDERGKIRTEKGSRNDDSPLTLSEPGVYTPLQMVEDDERGKIRTEKGSRNDDSPLTLSEVYTPLQMVEDDERGKIRTEKGSRNNDSPLTLSEVYTPLQMVEDDERGKIRTEKGSRNDDSPPTLGELCAVLQIIDAKGKIRTKN